MSNEGTRASTGKPAVFIDPYETRRIYIAEGIEAQEGDTEHRKQWKRRAINELTADPSAFRRTDEDFYKRLRRIVRNFGWHRRGWSDRRISRRFIQKLEQSIRNDCSGFQYLERKLGADFLVHSRQNAEYRNSQQKVRYELHIIYKKSEFKEKLETDGVIVIYDGHSRYGRGACFHQYQGAADSHGDHWENGDNADNGLFRLGYPYFAVPLEDIEHHKYHFAPVAVEDGPLPRERRHPFSRHPNMRRRLRRIILPEKLRGYVLDGYQSSSNTYYGFRKHKEKNIVLYADWAGSQSFPYDLGATDLRCKTFCHFGCSSRLHFWHIVRRLEYKGYERPDPPTDKFAYFTTAPSDHRTIYWIYFLLKYQVRNNATHWWGSHEWAKRRANRKLRRKRAGFLIY